MNPANGKPERNCAVDREASILAKETWHDWPLNSLRGLSIAVVQSPNLTYPRYQPLCPSCTAATTLSANMIFPSRINSQPSLPTGFKSTMYELTGRQWRGGIVACVRWGWYAIVGALASCESPPRLPRHFCIALHWMALLSAYPSIITLYSQSLGSFFLLCLTTRVDLRFGLRSSLQTW